VEGRELVSATGVELCEIGTSLDVAGVATNVLDRGTGSPVLLLHGSGPGVSAFANWRFTIPALAVDRRVVAFDQLGFGHTQRPADGRYSPARWTDHVLEVLDALELRTVDLIGNSFGGAIALRFAALHPDRVRRLVLMGSVGVSFPITRGLDEVWGYEPGPGAMRAIMSHFAYDQSLLSDELAEIRERAAARPGVQEAYAAMFPAPRQRWVDALATPTELIQQIPHEVLLIHGRDDRMIPLDTSVLLLGLIDRAQLHVFGRCGHWVQIEQAARFNALVRQFLGD
jgi:pimeloyl-ACP methyl ester carboxylesterase